MDAVYFNGSFLLPNGARASAAAVRDGRFAYVGSDEGALALRTADTRVEDLGGRLVLPGFIDTHIHLIAHGEYLSCADIAPARSKREAIDIGRRFLSEHPALELLSGVGWNNDKWSDDSTFPTRYELDEISRDIPVVYTRACYHVIALNSRALELCGIAESAPDIAGGEIYRDENGVPTGPLCEDAQMLAERAYPPVTKERVQSYIRAAAKDAASFGLTTVHADDLGMDGGGDMGSALDAYSDLLSREKLPVRIYQQCRLSDKSVFDRFYGAGFAFGQGDDRFRLGPMKLVIDGSLGARTAYLRSPYSDAPDTRGVMIYEKELLDELVCSAAERGMPSVIHAIGDAAIEMALDAFEKARRVEPRPLRHAVIHCQITDIALLRRMKALNVAAQVQPIFLDYDMHIAEERVGRELASTSYAFNTMRKLGIQTSFGSDCPVERFNAIQGIYHAVTRRDLSGFPEGGWLPDERMSVMDAVNAFTSGAAYASYDENVKGSIAVGMLADMAVLDRDIFEIAPEEIKNARVALTVLGGEITYDAR